MCLPDLSLVLVSVAGFRNAGSPSCTQDAANTTPTTTGAPRHIQSAHWHLDKSSTLLSSATTHYSNPAPARGTVLCPADSSIHPTTTLPPSAPNVLPYHIPPRQPCSSISPSHPNPFRHSTPPKRFCFLRALPRLQGRLWVRLAQSSQSNHIHPEARHRRMSN